MDTPKDAVISDFRFCYKVISAHGLIAFHDIYLIYPAIKEIRKFLNREQKAFIELKLRGSIFALCFDLEILHRDIVLRGLANRNKLKWHVYLFQQKIKPFVPKLIWDLLKTITRFLLIRLTHHATRCSVSWWRFAGRVKTAIPENTLGISVPVRN